MALAQPRIASARPMAPQERDQRAEESACIRRAQQGDVAAFEELVRLHQRRVLGIVAGILRWSEDIEDIAQQVFLKVFLAIRRFDGRSSFGTWLYKIAVNETYDYLRKRKARKLVYESDLSEEQQEQFNQVAQDDSSRAALEQAESRQAVERLLSELEPEERMMIVLKEVEGYSVEEISAAMDMNPNTVKVRMFRARRRLSELYRRRYGQRADLSAGTSRPVSGPASPAGRRQTGAAAGESRAPIAERT
ncbi:MAG TPA: sigma-70 family RNA polymerase sigma factor [Patescibacteria group bacterium]|nr:sigma-70 family RNA polymerase sigma factor [Patescibacteria group bacterium]